MATLLLRNVPDDLYERLKEIAASHHRSMNQEAIVALKYALALEPEVVAKPGWEDFSAQMRDLWAMPVLDSRVADDIIGYDENGLPR